MKNASTATNKRWKSGVGGGGGAAASGGIGGRLPGRGGGAVGGGGGGGGRAVSGSKTVLPSKFLLGGNIHDPLNLNSLNDEKIARVVNAVTPESSPLPTPKHRLGRRAIESGRVYP